MKRLYIIVFVFISYQSLKAIDNEFSTELISVSQGLPNSQITTIFQGSQGLMWIGTTNGLCIYDGYGFTVMQAVAFDSTTFADDNIYLIKQDRQDNIWLYTQYGIEKYNIKSDKSERVKFLDSKKSVIDILPSKNEDIVYLIFENKVEKINIIDTSSETIFLSENKNILCAELEEYTLALISNQEFIFLELKSDSVFKYHHGKNLLSADIIFADSLWCFSMDNKIYSTVRNDFSPVNIYDAGQLINSISGFYSNDLVYATENSVVQLELFNGSQLKKTEKYFSNKDLIINNIFQNQDRIIWVASDQGLYKINPFNSRIEHNQYSGSNVFYQSVLTESSHKGVIYKNKFRNTYYYSGTEDKHYLISIPDYTTVCQIDKNNLLIGSSNGLITTNIKTGRKEKIELFDDQEVYYIYNHDEKIWISTDEGLYSETNGTYTLTCSHRINKFTATNNEIFYIDSNDIGLIITESCLRHSILKNSIDNQFFRVRDMLQSYDAKIWLATDDGLYRFDGTTNNKRELFELVFKGKVYSIIEAEDLPEIWFASDKGIGSINYQNGQQMLLGYEDGIRNTSFLTSAAYYKDNGTLNFISTKEVISFNPDSIYRNNIPPDVTVSYVSYIKNKKQHHQLFIESDTVIIHPDIKLFEIFLTTLDYFAPLRTKYEYSLELESKSGDWIELSDNKLTIGSVDPGVYRLKVRAINSHGYKSSNNLELLIVIKAPLLQSKLAFLIYSVLLVISILLFIQFRTRNLRRINKEYKEKERIARKIELQKEELSLKNKNITDSINYARRIQLAMMPSAKNFKAIFPDSFILHMPKDIVSGDFYWVNKVSDKIFFSAVDCTGHGVPGAFMSIIGVELFRRITEIEKIFTPAEVLNSLSKHFDRVFGDVDEMKLRDGMDLAFCSLNAEHTILEYAGAFNPLYIIRGNSIIEIKGDRNSVGVYHDEDEVRVFNNHVLPIQDQDLIYIFTDGFADQFGGPEEKKYKYRRFRHLLLALHQLPMNKQEEFLKKSILEWKGKLDQVDDILVMGIRIHHNL
jgi:serine phosphatase RsbU (regulator of sigma subunit)